MQRISDVFEQPCKLCGCKMESVKELENINDLSSGYMRTSVLCRCKNGHEDVRVLELDGQKAVFSASVYQKDEWEQKTKKEELSMITLRSILGLMEDFNRITIVLSKQEVQAFPLFALEFFKGSILDRQVYRIESNRIYLEDGESEK